MASERYALDIGYYAVKISLTKSIWYETIQPSISRKICFDVMKDVRYLTQRLQVFGNRYRVGFYYTILASAEAKFLFCLFKGFKLKVKQNYMLLNVLYRIPVNFFLFVFDLRADGF